VAAVGDLHLGLDNAEHAREHFSSIGDKADVLLLAGDLTHVGSIEEAKAFAAQFSRLSVPVIGVLGNHDYHSGEAIQVTRILSDAGLTILEGATQTIDVDGVRVAIAGIKGFGGGFLGACASEFGEAEMKAFVHHTRAQADALAMALDGVEADVRIVLTHYAPTDSTLGGEPAQIHPFLGAYQLGEVIDKFPIDLAIHGHAHRGNEIGWTPCGVHVRNVAQPIIGHAYRVYCIEHQQSVENASYLEPV
jgi:Icc-related predicted phosphoesterase